jgi:hypothetical protein
MSLLRFVIPALSVAVVSLLSVATVSSGNAQAYSADVQGAQAFAADYCPDSVYSEDKIADYMWVTAPDGGDQISVVNGQSEQLSVVINFYATYCKVWPANTTNGAKNMKLFDGAGVQRLTSSQPSITYGPKTSPSGTRSEWGVGTYGATLDVSGWSTGWYTVCTSFETTTNRFGAKFKESPSACFPIHLTRIDPWTTSGESKVGVDFTPPNVHNWSASPNQMLYWRHTISAAGGTTPGLDFAVGKSGFSGSDVWGDGSAANHNKPVGTTSAIGAGSSYSVGWGANRPEYSQYKVLPSDGGRTLCQSISWGPSDYTKGPGDAWATSNNACVDVPFNYDLTPGVSGLNSVSTVGGTVGTVIPTVNNNLAGNSAATTDSPPVEWQLRRVEVPATYVGNFSSLPQAENGLSPCAYYTSKGAIACKDKGTNTRVFPAGNANPPLATLVGELVDPGTPVGTQICYTLSVQPYKQGGAWRHSAPDCVRVSKQPKLQVWGHDVYTRGNIDTGTTEVNDAGTNKLFGSWVEYGGFSVKANKGFASASGLNGGNTNTDATDAANLWNKLTFANVNNALTTSPPNHGGYTLPSGLPTITSQFIGPASGGVLQGNLGNVDSGTYVVGNFTLNASDVGLSPSTGKGKVIIIVSSGTIEIDGNITYRGPNPGDVFTKIDELPQVIIIAKNINIKNAVTQVDAWLLAVDKTTPASGAINTCSDVSLATSLTVDICNNPLTVNGPVVARHLYLRRTAGSDSVAAAGTPAEVFNMRPDTFLWAQARAGQAGKVQTVYSVELPPRF